MRAVVVNELTGPDGLRVMDVAEPSGEHPRADGHRVLVEVHSAGIAFPDLLQTRGEYQISTPPPFVSGGEFGGIVREASEGSGFAVGDRVAGMSIWGAMAELALGDPQVHRQAARLDVLCTGRGDVAQLLDGPLRARACRRPRGGDCARPRRRRRRGHGCARSAARPWRPLDRRGLKRREGGRGPDRGRRRGRPVNRAVARSGSRVDGWERRRRHARPGRRRALHRFPDGPSM